MSPIFGNSGKVGDCCHYWFATINATPSPVQPLRTTFDSNYMPVSIFTGIEGYLSLAIGRISPTSMIRATYRFIEVVHLVVLSVRAGVVEHTIVFVS